MYLIAQHKEDNTNLFMEYKLITPNYTYHELILNLIAINPYFNITWDENKS